MIQKILSYIWQSLRHFMRFLVSYIVCQIISVVFLMPILRSLGTISSDIIYMLCAVLSFSGFLYLMHLFFKDEPAYDEIYSNKPPKVRAAEISGGYIIILLLFLLIRFNLNSGITDLLIIKYRLFDIFINNKTASAVTTIVFDAAFTVFIYYKRRRQVRIEFSKPE